MGMPPSLSIDALLAANSYQRSESGTILTPRASTFGPPQEDLHDIQEEEEGTPRATPRGSLGRQRSRSFPAKGTAAQESGRFCMVDPNPAQVVPAQQPERVEELRDPRRTTLTTNEDSNLHKANVLARVGRMGRRGSVERGSTGGGGEKGKGRQSTAGGMGAAAGMAQLSIVDLAKGAGGYGFTCAQKGPLMVVFDVEASSEAAAAGVEVGDQLMMVQDLEGQLPPKSPGQVTWVEKHTPAVVAVIRGSKRCRFFFKPGARPKATALLPASLTPPAAADSSRASSSGGRSSSAAPVASKSFGIGRRLSMKPRQAQAPPRLSATQEPVVLPKAADDTAQLSIVDLAKKAGGYGFTCAQKGELMVVFDVEASSEAAAAGVEVGDQLMMVQDLEGRLPSKTPGAAVWVGAAHVTMVTSVIKDSARCRFSFKPKAPARPLVPTLNIKKPAAVRAGNVASRAERARRQSVQGTTEGPQLPGKDEYEQSQWLTLGLELAAADLDIKEVAQLGDEARVATAAARAWRMKHAGDAAAPTRVGDTMQMLDMGERLAGVNLDEDAEGQLSGPMRAAVAAAKTLQSKGAHTPRAAGSPVKGKAAVEDLSSAWLELGAELDDLGLDEDAEGQLGTHARDAMVVARALKKTGAPVEKKKAEGADGKRWLELGETMAGLGLDDETECTLSAQMRAAMSVARALATQSVKTPRAGLAAEAGQNWLDLGAELDELGLDEDAEGGLSTHARDALVAARALKVAAPKVTARGNKTARRGSRVADTGAAQPNPHADQHWLELGETMVGLGLDDDTECTLSAQMRAAMSVARALKTKGVKTPRGGGGDGVVAEAGRNWLDLGAELDELGLDEDAEGQLSSHAHDALVAARALKVKVHGPAAVATPRSRAQGFDAAKQWMGLGAAVVGLGLEEQAQSNFSAQMRAAMSAVRSLPAKSNQLGNGAGQSWLALGVELDELGLDEDVEGRLESHARDALVAARAMKMQIAKTAKTPRFAMAEEADGQLSSKARNKVMESQHFLDFGATLAGLGLGDEAEGTLSAQMRAAMSVARSLELPVAKGVRDEGQAWIELGAELDELGLDEATEGGLSSHVRDALVAARSLKGADGGLSAQARNKLAATKGDGGKRWLELGATLEGLGLGDAAESTLSAQMRAAISVVRTLGAIGHTLPSNVAGSNWLELGAELDDLGLDEDMEAELSSYARDALVAARALRMADAAAMRGVPTGGDGDGIDLDEDEEEVANVALGDTMQKRKAMSRRGAVHMDWVAFGAELLGHTELLGLDLDNDAFEAKLSTQTRDAIKAARAMREFGMENDDHEQRLMGEEDIASTPACKRSLAMGC